MAFMNSSLQRLDGGWQEDPPEDRTSEKGGSSSAFPCGNSIFTPTDRATQDVRGAARIRRLAKTTHDTYNKIHITLGNAKLLLLFSFLLLWLPRSEVFSTLVVLLVVGGWKKQGARMFVGSVGEITRLIESSTWENVV